MGNNTKISAVCKSCGTSLSADHKGPCPNCGKTGKKISVEINEKIGISDSLTWKKRREFLEERKGLKWILFMITVISPILGFFLSGLYGLVLGIVLGLITYVIGPYAVIKVREIERGKS